MDWYAFIDTFMQIFKTTSYNQIDYICNLLHTFSNFACFVLYVGHFHMHIHLKVNLHLHMEVYHQNLNFIKSQNTKGPYST